MRKPRKSKNNSARGQHFRRINHKVPRFRPITLTINPNSKHTKVAASSDPMHQEFGKVCGSLSQRGETGQLGFSGYIYRKLSKVVK